MSEQKEMYKAAILERLSHGPTTIPAMAREVFGKTTGHEYDFTKDCLKQAMRALASDGKTTCIGKVGHAKVWALTKTSAKAYHVEGEVMMKVRVSFDTGFAPDEEGFFDMLKEEAEASFFDWKLIPDISGLDIREIKED